MTNTNIQFTPIQNSLGDPSDMPATTQINNEIRDNKNFILSYFIPSVSVN